MYEPACITDSAICPSVISGIAGRSWMWMLLNPLRQRRVPILSAGIMQPCAIRHRRPGGCSDSETGKQKRLQHHIDTIDLYDYVYTERKI